MEVIKYTLESLCILIIVKCLKAVIHSKMNKMQFLCIVPIIIVTSWAGKLPATDGTSLEFMDQVLMDESVGECMCPLHLNSTGTFFEFCGHELAQPKNCSRDSVYRCVNQRKLAIETTKRCEKWGKKCQTQTSLFGGPCPKCIPHKLKECVK